MHRNAEEIARAAFEIGLTIEVQTFPDGTRTATDAAAAVGADVNSIVKSLVFLVDGRPDVPILALVAGGNRLDETKLATVANVDGVDRADADAVRIATGYPIGGVPPFGHPQPLTTYVDRDLLRHDRVWAAAGTPRDVFSIEPSVLVDAIGADVVDLAEH